MLVLSRKNRQTVVVGGGGGFLGFLKVTVLEVNGGKVKLGFEVDAGIPVHRLEIWERMCANGSVLWRTDSQKAGKDYADSNCPALELRNEILDRRILCCPWFNRACLNASVRAAGRSDILHGCTE